MPKLPVLSGREVVRGLERLGFATIGQRGSHIKLRKANRTVIVPDHREIRRGTLSGILKQANIAIEDLLSVVSN